MKKRFDSPSYHASVRTWARFLRRVGHKPIRAKNAERYLHASRTRGVEVYGEDGRCIKATVFNP